MKQILYRNHLITLRNPNRSARFGHALFRSHIVGTKINFCSSTEPTAIKYAKSCIDNKYNVVDPSTSEE